MTEIDKLQTIKKMKVVKSTWFKKIKSEYGEFDILPDKGCEINTFIDFESKLLIVRENTLEQRNSGKPYTPKMFILNAKNGSILSRQQYEIYFDYQPQKMKSDDGKWETIIQRKIDENGTDFIEETITNLETQEKLKPAIGVAFRQSKYESWIDMYHQEIERRKILESKLTLDQHFHKCLSALKKDDIILKFCEHKTVYKLIYNGSEFQLFSKIELINRELDWESNFTLLQYFSSINDFWKFMTNEIDWYIKFTPIDHAFGTDKLIAKLIVDFHNNFVYDDFETADYRILQKWMNSVYTESIKRSEYKQYCSNCKALTSHNSRYPKHICKNCYELISDSNGRKVEFFNTELMGHGCQGYYKGTEQKERYNSNIVYIDDKEYIAEEAYFGGIVLRKNEINDL